jgi:uncharacterized protein
MRKYFKILFLLILVFLFYKTNSQNVPSRVGVITDLAEILSSEDEKLISDAISKIYVEENIVVEVLTIKSLDGEDIDLVAQKVFNYWAISTKGVLLMASKEEREFRIEVGRDLTDKIPNSVCESIIQNNIVPSFKSEKYGEGIINGINSIQEEIKNPSKINSTSSNRKIYIIVAILLIVSFISRRIFRGRGGNYRSTHRQSHRNSSGKNSSSSRSRGGGSGKW